MATALLYSAGKDSTLAALLLAPFYDVTLVSGTFGLDEEGERRREGRGERSGPQTAGAVTDVARTGAAAIDLPIEAVGLDPDVARAAVDRMVEDGYPRHGIQAVHEHALETVAASDWDVVADGTRRDDRVPTVDRSFARSLEDRFDVDYVAPLAGFGRDAVDSLVERELRVETGPSETTASGDYETELRTLMAGEYGRDVVEDVFPEHTQSRVVGRRR